MLESAIKNYKHYFGARENPIVWGLSSSFEDAVKLAAEIYSGDKEWFWTNVVIKILDLGSSKRGTINRKYPEIRVLKSVKIGSEVVDIANLDSETLETIGEKLLKMRVICVEVKSSKDNDLRRFMREHNWTLVYEKPNIVRYTVDHVWVNTGILGQ